MRRVRTWLWIFVVCLVASGLTAFPLQTESRWLADLIGGSPLGSAVPEATAWAEQVRDGLADTGARYPFLAYGTDWLAFAHLVIAVAFWGPIQDPVRNVWVIERAMTACAGVIPLALICGPLRDIPLYWRFIDMSFGIVGVLPLLIVLRGIRRLERVGAPQADRPPTA
ncbi:membrane protein [Saccharothrix sp. ST-888]|nr:membrane protein [Saccharothrix sp. ST-888]